MVLSTIAKPCQKLIGLRYQDFWIIVFTIEICIGIIKYKDSWSQKPYIETMTFDT